MNTACTKNAKTRIETYNQNINELMYSIPQLKTASLTNLNHQQNTITEDQRKDKEQFMNTNSVMLTLIKLPSVLFNYNNHRTIYNSYILKYHMIETFQILLRVTVNMIAIIAIYVTKQKQKIIIIICLYIHRQNIFNI